MAQPLTTFLKKEGFQWDEESTMAFQKLKEALVSAPVLVLPDFAKTFVIESDTSGVGMGAMLMQEGQAIAFMSKAFFERQRYLPIYEKEMQAILAAIKKWRPQLLGRPFVIRTNQISLKYLMDQQIHTLAQGKWLTRLLGFDYRVEYKPGCSNKVADALLRQQGLEQLGIQL